MRVFDSLKITNVYPKGTALFLEGQPANGVYMLCQGRVKLSTCSRDGRIIILRIAEPGEVLGISAVVTNSVHESSAEVLDRCSVSFIRKAEFLSFLHRNADASFNAARQLSHIYQTAHAQIRSIGLSNTVAERLAKLFLRWCREAGKESNGVHLKISFTQEEIAEMIGTSRETVSRLLKDFKDNNLITVKGSDLIIHDVKKLEATIGFRSAAQSESCDRNHLKM